MLATDLLDATGVGPQLLPAQRARRFRPGPSMVRARAQAPPFVVTKQECRMRLRDMRDMSPTTALWRSSAIVAFLRLSYEAPAASIAKLGERVLGSG